MGSVTRVFRCPYIEGNLLIELMEGRDTEQLRVSAPQSMIVDLALSKYDTLFVEDIECIDRKNLVFHTTKCNSVQKVQGMGIQIVPSCILHLRVVAWLVTASEYMYLNEPEALGIQEANCLSQVTFLKNARPDTPMVFGRISKIETRADGGDDAMLVIHDGTACAIITWKGRHISQLPEQLKVGAAIALVNVQPERRGNRVYITLQRSNQSGHILTMAGLFLINATLDQYYHLRQNTAGQTE
ncbi:hypothetical protein MP228_006071 [Amoeboaphelidium protococcarum]|nr:hypothetical protein MP228_006071 [Amoeboaphelidium protococcarum]